MAWADAPESERRFIYDTTLFGYGNGGHAFGEQVDEPPPLGRVDGLDQKQLDPR